MTSKKNKEWIRFFHEEATPQQLEVLGRFIVLAQSFFDNRGLVFSLRGKVPFSQFAQNGLRRAEIENCVSLLRKIREGFFSSEYVSPGRINVFRPSSVGISGDEEYHVVGLSGGWLTDVEKYLGEYMKGLTGADEIEPGKKIGVVFESGSLYRADNRNFYCILSGGQSTLLKEVHKKSSGAIRLDDLAEKLDREKTNVSRSISTINEKFGESLDVDYPLIERTGDGYTLNKKFTLDIRSM